MDELTEKAQNALFWRKLGNIAISFYVFCVINFFIILILGSIGLVKSADPFSIENETWYGTISYICSMVISFFAVKPFYRWLQKRALKKVLAVFDETKKQIDETLKAVKSPESVDKNLKEKINIFLNRANNVLKREPGFIECSVKIYTNPTNIYYKFEDNITASRYLISREAQSNTSELRIDDSEPKVVVEFKKF